RSSFVPTLHRPLLATLCPYTTLFRSMEALGARGQLVTGGSPLEYEGKRVAPDGVITDIAASELKELVSGYSIVKAKDYDEAVQIDRKSTRLNSSHVKISYAVFCLKKK